MPSVAPQQSTRAFVAPATSAPIKKTPDITEIRGERYEVSGDVGASFTLVQSEISADTHLTPQTSHLTPHTSHLTPQTSSDFSEHWHTAFTQIFQSVPTVYFALKDTLPIIENNIIKVTAKNDIQKEHFEAKTREVLEYLRTHYDEKIEDIVVETDEKMETKKIIYDDRDKLLNFKEQNEEFDEFLQILDLKIKD